MNMDSKRKKRRTYEEKLMLSRWFDLLLSLNMSAKRAAFYIGYIMDDPVTQTTLWSYHYHVQAKAKAWLKQLNIDDSRN
jgi:hypothetical protein